MRQWTEEAESRLPGVEAPVAALSDLCLRNESDLCQKKHIRTAACRESSDEEELRLPGVEPGRGTRASLVGILC